METGEHYICAKSANEYRQMWRFSRRAGVLIGLMALLKIGAAGLHARPCSSHRTAVASPIDMALASVLTHLLGLTVATQAAGDDRAKLPEAAQRWPSCCPCNRQCGSRTAGGRGSAASAAQPAGGDFGNVLRRWRWLSAVIARRAGGMSKAQLLADLIPELALPHRRRWHLFCPGWITGFLPTRPCRFTTIISAWLAQHPGW